MPTDRNETVLPQDRITTTVDEHGGRTTYIPPAIAKKERELAALLIPDHECTGSGGMGYDKDGGFTSYSRPCPGCVRQRERVLKTRPDLVTSAVRTAQRGELPEQSKDEPAPHDCKKHLRQTCSVCGHVWDGETIISESVQSGGDANGPALRSFDLHDGRDVVEPGEGVPAQNYFQKVEGSTIVEVWHIANVIRSAQIAGIDSEWRDAALRTLARECGATKQAQGRVSRVVTMDDAEKFIKAADLDGYCTGRDILDGFRSIGFDTEVDDG
jgi:hypothetical protein